MAQPLQHFCHTPPSSTPGRGGKNSCHRHSSVPVSTSSVQPPMGQLLSSPGLSCSDHSNPGPASHDDYNMGLQLNSHSHDHSIPGLPSFGHSSSVLHEPPNSSLPAFQPATLNPAAPVFLPLSKPRSDPVLPIFYVLLDEFFLPSVIDALPAPPPCSCHTLPLGSCPDLIA